MLLDGLLRKLCVHKINFGKTVRGISYVKFYVWQFRVSRQGVIKIYVLYNLN